MLTSKDGRFPRSSSCYPWIARTFPEANYIQWIHDPRDCIIRHHTTDDLRDFGISYPETDENRERRAILWYYQYQIMKASPDPANVNTVRFEQFVLSQGETLQRLEEFLGF